MPAGLHADLAEAARALDLAVEQLKATRRRVAAGEDAVAALGVAEWAHGRAQRRFDALRSRAELRGEDTDVNRPEDA